MPFECPTLNDVIEFMSHSYMAGIWFILFSDKIIYIYKKKLVEKKTEKVKKNKQEKERKRYMEI